MINYFEAAEKTLRARGLLETALGNLERKKERILRYGAPSEYPSADMSKPYTGAKSVNDALADCLELAEVMREIQITRDKVEEIDGVLAQMDEDDARILRLWYIERKSKDEITEAVCYRSKGFYEFDIVERGKPRHIRSVHISERVVQRCLCDYCLVPMLSRSFIYDNGASLRGKGYDFAVSRVTHFLAEHYRKHGREGYVLVFDFSKYFDTAQHEPVFREFERSGIDDRLVALSKYFIQNFGDVGLGLGSQVSQIAALALPNRIDHYIKDVLGMKYYARYMDDGCIISESKAELEICLRELRRLCAEHGIRLNPKKTQIIKLTRGFTFVKVRFRYGANGKVVRRATYKGIRHMRAKLRIFRRWVDSGRMTAADVETSLVSWRGHMKRFHSYHMEQSVERLYRELFKGG